MCFDWDEKLKLFYYSTYFCYYSWVSLHFLVLFIGYTVLFQSTFTFIYSIFSNKFSVSAKLAVFKHTLILFFWGLIKETYSILPKMFFYSHINNRSHHKLIFGTHYYVKEESKCHSSIITFIKILIHYYFFKWYNNYL